MAIVGHRMMTVDLQLSIRARGQGGRAGGWKGGREGERSLPLSFPFVVMHQHVASLLNTMHMHTKRLGRTFTI
jgi:hypothetical protein